MKLVFIILVIAFSSLAQASVFKDGAYISFKRAWFGKELPGNLFEVVNMPAIQKRVAEIKKSQGECEENYGIQGGTSGKIQWMKISLLPACEPDFDLPTIFITSIPASTKKYAVLGGSIFGIGMEIEKILISEHTATQSFLNLTILSTGYGDGGGRYPHLGIIYLDIDGTKKTVATGFRNVNLPDAVDEEPY